MRLMRKLRKQPVGSRNDRDFSLEAGDRVFERCGEAAVMYDLRESTGWHQRTAGELTPHIVKKNGSPRLAVMGDNGTWYWTETPSSQS